MKKIDNKTRVKDRLDRGEQAPEGEEKGLYLFLLGQFSAFDSAAGGCFGDTSADFHNDALFLMAHQTKRVQIRS